MADQAKKLREIVNKIETADISITSLSESQKKLMLIGQNMVQLLIEKNKRYGNSALKPLGIFSQHDAGSSICIRLDDKLKRVKNSEELRKNDIADLIGYLFLLCAEKDWTDFKEFID